MSMPEQRALYSVGLEESEAPSPQPALRFAQRGLGWSLGLFGLMRLPWFQAEALVPLTQLQARLAGLAFGMPVRPIEVTLACSGTDALALCIGAILAYPATWSRRLTGAAGGIALILALNIVRLGTLGRAAGSPRSFEALHLYVWPALLTLAIAGYVFGWIRKAERYAITTCVPTLTESAAVGVPAPPPTSRRAAPLTRRFVVLAAVFLALFTMASPLYLTSTAVLTVASVIARGAAVALGILGVPAASHANVLATTRGAFLVTQECILTPLIPVYLAVVFALSTTWPRRALALLATGPLFGGLGIARLLVVALPPALVGSPMFLVHAFYQLLLAGVVVVLAATWRHGANAMAWRRALVGGVLGGLLAYLLVPPFARALASVFAAGPAFADPQGAIAFLPPFQIGLYVALCMAAFVALEWRTFATGLALLGLSQVALVAVLHLVVTHVGLLPQVRDVRAWAVAGPLLAVAAVLRREP
jgi:exosortase/archaeosortase family protein